MTFALTGAGFVAAKLNALLCDVLQGVGKIAASGRRRKGFSFLLVELDGFIYDLAKLRKNLLFVRAMATPIEQTWGATHKTLIRLGPLNNLGVKSTFLHFLDSWTAFATARI
jgi:hypothetical protein